MDTIRGRPLP
jgi:hypothetical protein